MAGESGFLILSHQMLSMVGPLSSALRQRGIGTYVLSSCPSRPVEAAWRSQVAGLHVTGGHALDASDVEVHLKELSAAGVTVLGALTVWDAYRELMARANARIGAPDLSAAVVRGIRDKLAMRATLRDAGLTRTRAWPLDGERFAALADRSRYVVKPRGGLASLGVFRADRLDGAADPGAELAALWRRASADTAYAGVFTGEPAFLVEEFIDGTECSFEVGVRHGESVVYAVHEKVDLRQSGRTVLENACVCPPRSVGPADVERGARYVRRCLEALGADAGVFHVEARFDPVLGWDIVEVNARIGGACIVPSTRRHSGVDLLELWIDLLLDRPAPAPADERRSTFFRVFFGEPGRVVARLERRPGPLGVVEEKVFVREGEMLPTVDREIFVGQALWDTTGMGPGAVEEFAAGTEQHLRVEYRP